MLGAGRTSFNELRLEDGVLYWTETRPGERGRSVIVAMGADGEAVDLLPAPYSARARVHEYGGGAFLVNGKTVFFTNFADQRVYRLERGAEPVPVTPAGRQRFADYVHDSPRARLIGVREDHGAAEREPVNEIVAIPLSGTGPVAPLLTGNDFYSSPRLDAEGERLAWLTWNHPDMPWNGTELWVADIADDGSLTNASMVAGGESESVVQPRWSPDGTLYFVSDRSNWWNLYRWDGLDVAAIHPKAAEFAHARWVFGMSNYAFVSAREIVCSWVRNGRWRVGMLRVDTGELDEIALPFTSVRYVVADHERAVVRVGSPSEHGAMVAIDPATGSATVLRESAEMGLDEDDISVPRPVAFATEGGLEAYGFYYPPRNRRFVGLPDERPPLLVQVHGGPTGAARDEFDIRKQFWTTRGFALLDVNYGGSTGYGREFRDRLQGRWGVVDVQDAIRGAQHLVERGEVDPGRLLIRGGSAGGYTTLTALASSDLFRAGASYYGLSDLELFIDETHKYESRYLDYLVGPYPERRDLYLERSALTHLDRFDTPVILFQGLDDKIVPPDQAERMVEALREKGLPVAYLSFEGEGHGFRRADTIVRCLEAELYFYSRVLDLELPDDIPPVEIYNLP
jgi:dipeptidyl aminopeptidase/acylaminoacyl peptidase